VPRRTATRGVVLPGGRTDLWPGLRRGAAPSSQPRPAPPPPGGVAAGRPPPALCPRGGGHLSWRTSRYVAATSFAVRLTEPAKEKWNCHAVSGKRLRGTKHPGSNRPSPYDSLTQVQCHAPNGSEDRRVGAISSVKPRAQSLHSPCGEVRRLDGAGSPNVRPRTGMSRFRPSARARLAAIETTLGHRASKRGGTCFAGCGGPILPLERGLFGVRSRSVSWQMV
jgi:hypothetical protein